MSGAFSRNILEFHRAGYVRLDRTFDSNLLGRIGGALASASRSQRDGIILERDGSTQRAIHGSHLYSDAFYEVINDAEIREQVEAILDADVYLYQFKINSKAPFAGGAWPWHQDYIYWKNNDGMPTDNALTVMVFLDDVNEFNGPMYVIPGSHLEGCIDVGGEDGASLDEDWSKDVGEDLRFTIPNDVVELLAVRHGMHSLKGPAGSVFAFHSNIVHCSPQNISPYLRRILFCTYNSAANAPKLENLRRPEFLVTRR